ILEFPGFSGQTLASGFSRRSDAEVQAPDPGKSSFSLRIHSGASRPVQRADDVSRPRGGPERLLRLAETTGVEPRAGGRPVASPGSRVLRSVSRHLWRSARLSRSAWSGMTLHYNTWVHASVSKYR